MGKERMIPGDWRGCREGGTVLVEVERMEGRHGDR